MRKFTGHYPTYLRMAYADRTVIREFRRWRALSASRNGRLLILLDEYERRQITICEYASHEERERDIQVLRDIDEEEIQAAARKPKPPRGGNGAPPVMIPIDIPRWLPFPIPKDRGPSLK